MVDATIVPVPKQRNSREENEAVKIGKTPADEKKSNEGRSVGDDRPVVSKAPSTGRRTHKTKHNHAKSRAKMAVATWPQQI
jgi:hypothetical protein